jgi:hypothetical protein
MLHHPTPFRTSPPPPEVKRENGASPVANFVEHKRQLQACLSHVRTAYVFQQAIIRPILHVGCKVTHTKTRTMFVFLPSTNVKWTPFLLVIRKVSVQNSAREQSMLNETFCVLLSSFLPSVKWMSFLLVSRKVSVQNSAREQSMLNEAFCIFLSSFRQMPRKYFTLCHRPIPFTSNAIHYSLLTPLDAI